jgi:hypothetical protein
MENVKANLRLEERDYNNEQYFGGHTNMYSRRCVNNVSSA